MVRNDKAFTFLELTVVLFLIGLMLALTIPRIRHGVLSDDLKATARRMIGTIKTLRSNAVQDQKGYQLCFDLESNLIWVEWDGMTSEERDAVRQSATKLPVGISVLDVYRKGVGTQDVGEAKIHLLNKAMLKKQ
jgi:Tfp pilus assembly protein FimT